MFSRTLIATLATLLFASVPATAEQGKKPAPQIDAARSGPYLGITGLVAFENGGTNILHLNDTPSNYMADVTGGLEIYGGVNFSTYAAVELYGDWLEDLTDLSFGVMLKARYPIDRYAPYLGFGAGLNWVDGRKSLGTRWGGVVIFTGGCDFYITDNIAIDVEANYRKGTGTNLGINYITTGAGIKYLF
ncbi:MAG: outer membrane beta-barrel protein [Deltaproteobacteria bacterium]|nr:outer membrane beta-barrel protein [Deltaproteobacteria bacterium]